MAIKKIKAFKPEKNTKSLSRHFCFRASRDALGSHPAG